MQTSSVSLISIGLAHSTSSPLRLAPPLLAGSYRPRTRYTCEFLSSGLPVIMKFNPAKPTPCTSTEVPPMRVLGAVLGDTVMPLA